MPNQFLAYQDERHGLGARVAQKVATDLFGGAPGSARLMTPGGDVRAGAPSADNWTSPRISADATMSAVMSSKAHFGVLPLYDHDGGFRRDTLAALIDFPSNEVVREDVAESKFVLAAPASIVHEIEQASHANSFGTGSARDFQWNQDKQRRYLNRVETIYASAEAIKQCEAALDGYRARGIDIQQIPDGVDTFRQGLKIAHSMLDPGRVVETRYSTDSHERVSRMRGVNQTKPLIAVLLSFDKLANPEGDGYQYDQDYVVLDTDIAGADGIHTSFVVLRKNAPSIPPQRANKARWERRTLKSRYCLSLDNPGEDHRALYPTQASRPLRSLTGDYLRTIYKVDTIGPKAGDIGAVLQLLHGTSHMTTTLDNRPGHPMVILLDIPTGTHEKFMPAIERLTRMEGYRRLAAYPVDRPLIKEPTLPGQSSIPPSVKAAAGIVAIIAAAGAALWLVG